MDSNDIFKIQHSVPPHNRSIYQHRNTN